MEWIDIKTKKPSLEDLGKEFLVAVKIASGYEYQVCEWWDEEDGETEPYFLIENSWGNHSMVEKEVSHWANIPDLLIL